VCRHARKDFSGGQRQKSVTGIADIAIDHTNRLLSSSYKGVPNKVATAVRAVVDKRCEGNSGFRY
jgi:hypothetical protein